ncbi:MAG: penicillin-binding protein [Chloroflexota bacterium]|nr:penicillin-binding protein [Chloroflexota bacterium]
MPVIGALVEKAARAFEKLEFEFACGWALEQTALWHPSPDRDVILLYLNEVEWGHQAHGIRAAARVYFDKRASELTIPEAALLAGLLRAPGTYDPWDAPDLARMRRGQVLQAMIEQGHLTAEEAAAYDTEPLGVLDAPLHPPRRAERFVIDPTMAELERRDLRGFSTSNATVMTTLDLDLQTELSPIVRETIDAAAAGGVNDAGVVVLDPRTGEITAWFGGAGPVAGADALPDMVSDYRHEPGSTIKPLVYACALEYGVLAPDEWLDDTERIIEGRHVANWDLKSWGEAPAAEMLAGSRNVPAAELVARMSPAAFARCLHDVFGVQTDVQPERHGVELGLGLAEMSLLELARAYAILANGGVDVQPTAVLGVYDEDGSVRYEASPVTGRRVLSCGAAAWVQSALLDVSVALGLPAGVASKTGTTPSTSGIAGYSDEYVVVGWLGRAEPDKGLMAVEDASPGASAILQRLAWNALPTPPSVEAATPPCDDEGWTPLLPRLDTAPSMAAWSDSDKHPDLSFLAFIPLIAPRSRLERPL